MVGFLNRPWRGGSIPISCDGTETLGGVKYLSKVLQLLSVGAQAQTQGCLTPCARLAARMGTRV